jgi:predicted metalloprotease
MRWRGRERSTNVQDIRGMRGPVAVGGGGILMVLLVIALRLMDAPPAVQQMAGQAAQRMQQAGGGAEGAGFDDEHREFVEVVLRDTENVWTALFRSEVEGGSYSPPKLVLYSDSVTSGCGNASAAMGPFYCPSDQKIYVDPGFFSELAERHNAPGDFAQAYVIAHEVSHHVQNLTEFMNIAHQARARGDERYANQMSVRLELQADFLAGVWAHHAHREFDILEPGDMEEAITAANQIGDDTLQKESMGYVVPERFTHGTSAQRVKWFRRGLESGKMADCEELFRIDYERL